MEAFNKFVDMLQSSRVLDSCTPNATFSSAAIVAGVALLIFMGLNFGAAGGSVSGPVIGTTWMLAGLISGASCCLIDAKQSPGLKTITTLATCIFILLGSLAAGGAVRPYTLGWTFTVIFLITLGCGSCALSSTLGGYSVFKAFQS